MYITKNSYNNKIILIFTSIFCYFVLFFYKIFNLEYDVDKKNNNVIWQLEVVCLNIYLKI